MASKFETILATTGAAAVKRRATQIARDGGRAAENLVRTIEDKISQLDSEIFDLEDLSVKSTESLMPADGKFKAEDWARRMMDARVTRTKMVEQLEVAKAIVTEYFEVADTKEEAKS